VGGVVLSSPVIQEAEPNENGQHVEESTPTVIPPAEENAILEPTIESPGRSNNAEVVKSNSEGESKPQLLNVTRIPMGRTSR